MKDNVVNIDEWTRDAEDSYVYPDGKSIVLNIKKVQPNSFKRFHERNPEAVKAMGRFDISRDAFANKNDEVCQYLDYFMEFYDPDKELALAYANLKKTIDSRKDSITDVEYVKLLISRLILETNIRGNLYKLVEDCYDYDVTVDKNGREYHGPYDFTNDEAKILLAIAFMMKMVIPPTEHYISTNTLYTTKQLSGLMCDIFSEIFYLVGDREDDEADTILIKLYMYTMKQVTKHVKGNSRLWDQENALRGVTDVSHTDLLVVKYMLSDNFFKLRFFKNVVSFIKSIIETQLHFTIEITPYKKNPVALDFTSGPEGLSNIDKIEQLRNKMDESQPIRIKLSIEDILNRLKQKVGPISEEEIEFYKKYPIQNNQFHTELLRNYFAKYFDGYSAQKVTNERTNTELTIIAKRLMEKDGYKQLPYLMSSVPHGKVSRRLLRNKKFIDKFKASEKYQDLMERKYKALKGYKDDDPITLISLILNNTFRFVDYNRPELTGEEIEFDEDIISDELLSFIDGI